MSFNGKRFVQTVKWTEAICFSDSVKQTVIMAALIFIITLMAPYGEWVNDSIRAIAGPVIVALTFFFIGVGTQITHDMRTQQGRLFAMMLPSSTLEKYLARLLHVTVGTIIISAVAVVAADALSMVYRLISEGQLPSSLTLAVLEDVWGGMFGRTDGAVERIFVSVTAVLTTLLGHAFFVLGGVFFRRAKLPLTFLAAFVLMMFFGFSSVNLLSGNMMFEVDTEYAVDVYSVFAVCDGVLLLLIVACHLVAYWLFRRMQLINNKWVNL